MVRKAAALALLGIVALSELAAGQATGTPSFNAPYRAFERHEFGGTVSFLSGGVDATAVEGQYRFGYRTFDIGLRAGLLFRDGPAPNSVVIGIEARNRVITHTPKFPVDGSLIFGAGLDLRDGGTGLIVPIGLSLGRRLDLEGSEISIIPYVQPTGFITSNPGAGGRDTDFNLGIGFGADFRLSAVFDARVSVGVGDGPEGVSITAVWVR